MGVGFHDDVDLIPDKRTVSTRVGSESKDSSRRAKMLQQRCMDSVAKMRETFKNSRPMLQHRISQLEIGETLGRGGFGEVHSIRSISSEDGEHETFTSMALKQIRGSLYGAQRLQAQADLAKEAEFLRALSTHPNIITLHATGIIGSPDFFLVMDKLEKTFEDMIYKEWNPLYEQRDVNTSEMKLSKREIKKENTRNLMISQITLLIEVCSAYSFLHDNLVLFRDVKPENVGIDFDGIPKVFDFGLARELKEDERLSKDEYKLTPQTGSRVYMAPEVFNSQPYGLPYDVYSFSIMVSSLHGILIACQLSPFSQSVLAQHSFGRR